MPQDSLAIRLGDEVVYRGLLTAHDRRVHAYTRRLAVNGDEEDDLAAETWAIAWMQRDKCRGTGEYIAWLMRICRTVCSRALRTRREHDALSDVEAAASQTEGDAVGRQSLEDAHLDVMMSLPPRQRLCVILRVINGLNTARTAMLMQCSEGTVRATLFAGLRTLRPKIAELASPTDS
jgi:RNA polymerase sigma-70 factor, ECF subfamily